MAKLQAEMRAEIDPHILAWRCTDTGKERLIFFLAPYLAHRCMNVSLAPGPCALSLDKAPCFLSLIQTGLLCLQNSQYFP